MLFVGFLAIAVMLWPIAWSLLSIYLLWSRQWKRLGWLILLIPVWLIAPVVCLDAIGPSLPFPDAPDQRASGFGSLLVSTVAAVVVWWLLLLALRGAVNTSRKAAEVSHNGS